MRALVTGASGFVGRHLVAHLEAEGDTVVGLDRNGPCPTDITDAEAVRRRVADVQPDAVYHLAALTHVGESFEQRDSVSAVNIDGTRNLLDACAGTNVRAIVVVGSAEQYGAVDDDELPIRETAAATPALALRGEQGRGRGARAARADAELGVPAILVRAFNHTGPGQSPRFLVPALASRIVAAEATEHRRARRRQSRSRARRERRARRRPRVPSARTRRCARARPTTCAPGGASRFEPSRSGCCRWHSGSSTSPSIRRSCARWTTPVLIGDGGKIRYETGWAPEIDLTRTLWEVLHEARQRAASTPP